MSLQLQFLALAATSFAGAHSGDTPSPESQNGVSQSRAEASAALLPDLNKALADYDGDGLLDALTLTTDGHPRLLWNAGPTGFVDATAAAGLTAVGASQGAAWHDVDGDGRVDLTLFTPEGGVRLLYNGAGGLFGEGTEGSGLEHVRGVVAAHWTDLDGDGLSELWTRRADREQLWNNNGDGTFSELTLPAAEPSGLGESGASGAGGGYSINAGSANPAAMMCLPQIQDQAGGCLVASSTPSFGQLFPLSVATVSGLSADTLDGIDSSVFTQLGQSIQGSEISNQTVTGSNIAFSTITGSNVAPSSLTGSDIQTSTLSGAHILTGSVPGTDLVPNSVTTNQIANNTITAIDIAIGGVTGNNIANGTVRGSNVFDGTLTEADLASGTLTGASLAPNSVNSSHIVSGAVGATDIAPNAINSNHIQAGSVNSTDIQDGQVGANDLALFSITNANISGSAAISGSKIVSHFGAQDLSTDNRLGVGTVTPLKDVHVVGSPTMGTVLITPDEPVGGEDAELILGETDAGDYGMRMSYDGGTNTMSLGGVFAGVNTPHWQLTRDSGRMGIGAAPFPDARVNIDDDNRWGIRVTANSTNPGITYGVSAVNSGAAGIGIYGEASDSTGVGGAGVYGATSAPLGFGISCAGTFIVTGAKLFTQPHPQDASKEVRFVCLEGNESGTYFRGSSKLIGGEAVIDVPEEFRLVSEGAGLTVQVTSVGLPAALYVVSKDLDRIVVRGNVDVDFDYFVNGVRRGYGDFETMAENRFFVPTERGVPFGTQYPEAVRQILVENGTLNPDYTPNEATAAANGWTLRDPAPLGTIETELVPVD